MVPGDWGGGGGQSQGQIRRGGQLRHPAGVPLGSREAPWGAGIGRETQGPDGGRPLVVHRGIAPRLATPPQCGVCTDEICQRKTKDRLWALGAFLSFKVGMLILRS